MRTPSLLLPVLAVLAGCQQSEATDGRGGQSALERAALDAGVVSDAAATDPAGLYARQHEGGRDTLCMAPDGKAGRYSFGLDVNIGAGEYCRGSGKARRTGDKLILRFSGRSDCLVVAGYESDRIALPGVLDIKCNALCADRASMEGVSFPLLSSDVATARAAKGQAGDRLCG